MNKVKKISFNICMIAVIAISIFMVTADAKEVGVLAACEGDYATELASYNLAKKEYDDKATGLEAELTSLKEKQTKYTEKLDDYKTKLTTYMDNLSNYDSIYSDNYKILVSGYEANLTLYKDKLKLYDVELDDYNIDLTNYNNDLKNYDKDLIGYDDLLKEYNAVLKKYNDLNTDYENASKEYDKIKLEYDAVKTFIDVMKDKYNLVDAEYSSLLEEYTKLETEYTSLEKEKTTFEEKIVTLNGEYTTLEAEFTNLSSLYDCEKQAYDDAVEQNGKDIIEDNSIQTAYEALIKKKADTQLIIDNNKKPITDFEEFLTTYPMAESMVADGPTTEYDKFNADYITLKAAAETAKNNITDALNDYQAEWDAYITAGNNKEDMPANAFTLDYLTNIDNFFSESDTWLADNNDIYAKTKQRAEEYVNVTEALDKINTVLKKTAYDYTTSSNYFYDKGIDEVFNSVVDLNELYAGVHYEDVDTATKQKVIDTFHAYEVDSQAAMDEFINNGKTILEADWQTLNDEIAIFNKAIADYNAIDPNYQMKEFNRDTLAYRIVIDRINAGYQWFNNGINFYGDYNRLYDYRRILEGVRDTNIYWVDLRKDDVDSGTIEHYVKIVTGGWYAKDENYEVTDLDRYWYALFTYSGAGWMTANFSTGSMTITDVNPEVNLISEQTTPPTSVNVELNTPNRREVTITEIPNEPVEPTEIEKYTYQTESIISATKPEQPVLLDADILAPDTVEKAKKPEHPTENTRNTTEDPDDEDTSYTDSELPDTGSNTFVIYTMLSIIAMALLLFKKTIKE